MSKIDLTAQRLRELLEYDPETGEFRCREKMSTRIRPGRLLGYTKGRYIVIRLLGETHKAHRLAWLYATGHWPTNAIDHIDGDGLNNRLANLRDLPQRHNVQNELKARINNLVGFLGVNKNKGRYRARIRNCGQLIHLGSFVTPEEAHAAYVAAKRRLHPGSTL